MQTQVNNGWEVLQILDRSRPELGCQREMVTISLKYRVCSHLIEDIISPAALGEFQQSEHALSALGDHGVPPALVAGAEGFAVHLHEATRIQIGPATATPYATLQLRECNAWIPGTPRRPGLGTIVLFSSIHWYH